MKILLINHFPLEGSGSGIYTKNIAKSLSEKGHDIYIIVPENTQFFPKLEGIEIHPVYFKQHENIKGQLPFNFPCFTTHPNSYESFFNMDSEQIKMYVSAFEKIIDKAILTFKPDIIHCGHIWILSSIATKYNIPLVITAHGTDIIGHQKSSKFHSYANDAAEKCKKIITISKDNNSLVVSEFPKAKDKTFLLSNGYDPSIFYQSKYDKKEVLSRLGIDGNYDKIVCFAGKLTKIKGVDLLIKAAEKYENENILTIIAGNGELFDELNSLVKTSKLKNVKFVGNVEQTVLREIYNISDVSIVPSRKEAFGLVAIEALACGTPVVATNQGGIPDFLKKEVGILIETDNYNMLAQAIIEILNNDLFDKNYIAKNTKENYSQTKLIEKLIDVYKSCL